MTRKPLWWTLGLVVLVCVPLWWWYGRCGPATTMIVVRHADRAGDADALSPAGGVRAEALAHVCRKAGVAAIYVSNTERAAATAAPLATALGLTPIDYPGADVAALVSQALADYGGRVVVVVGHSDTVPLIIAAAGGGEVPAIPAGEFDNLFVLTVRRSGWWARTSVVNLQYGAASP